MNAFSKVWKKIVGGLPSLGNVVVSALVLAVPGTGGSALAREVSITLLQTTDLHGRLDNPVPERAGDSPAWGLLRLGSLIEAARKQSPNALLVDCGDTLQGTPYSRDTRGRLIVRAMEMLRYDGWVPGNHDFDWGYDVFKAIHDQTALTLLGANISGRPGMPHPLPKLRPFIIREVDGVRVALIGLTTPGIPNWLTPEKLGPLTFARSRETLEAVMPRVRAERADVFVLLAHQGQRPQDDFANEINAVAQAFPELDLIFGGHTHEAVEGREINGVLFVQAGYHGRFLARADLVFDTVARRVIRRSARLIPVTDDTPEHPVLLETLGPELRRRNAALERPVGEAAAPVPAVGVAPGWTAVAALLRAAIAEATGAEIVVHGQLSEASLAAGFVRERDLWRLVPYENSLGVAQLTVGEIREILEENAAQWGSRSFMGVRGLAGILRLDAPIGERVRRLTLPDGSTPHARRRFSVAFNSHAIASAGMRSIRLREIVRRPEARLAWADMDTRDALRTYLQRYRPIQPADDPSEGWQVEWPASGAPSATSGDPG